MAGVYRGMVDDAKVLLRAVDADIWVVQQNTLGPFAEPSSLPDDRLSQRSQGCPGSRETGNVAYLTMQVAHGGKDRSASWWRATSRAGRRAGLSGRGPPHRPSPLRGGGRRQDRVRGRRRVRIRRNDYTVVGLTRRMVSSGGDPMLFIPLKDAQEAQFLKDNESIVNDRNRLAANPAVNRPGQPGVLEAVEAIQTSSHRVNAVLVRRAAGARPASGGRQHRALEAPHRLHQRRHGRHPGGEADRHRGQADRPVPGHPGGRERGHRGLHHLHDDARQDQGNRRPEADRHPRSHHRRDDHAGGAGPRASSASSSASSPPPCGRRCFPNTCCSKPATRCAPSC